MDARPKAARQRTAIAAGRSTDLLLVLYAIAAGVLIVSFGVLLAEVERQWSPSTRILTLVATAAVTVIAGVAADAVLRWYRSSGSGLDA